MLITGCVSYRAAWKSLELETLVVLAAAIGLDSAITASWLSQAIGDTMATLAGDNTEPPTRPASGRLEPSADSLPHHGDDEACHLMQQLTE